MPPIIWLRAASGLMIRPAPYTPTARLHRTSPSSAIHPDLDEQRAVGVYRQR